MIQTPNECLPSSTTLAPEWSKAGRALLNSWKHGGEVYELHLKRELNIRKYHLNVAPFSSIQDVAAARSDIAKVLDTIASRRSSQRRYVIDQLKKSRNKPKRSQIHRTQVPHRYQNIHRHSKKG